MRVSEEAYGGREAWDAYVASRPESLFYHRQVWRLAVENAYGERAFYLAARNEDGVLAGVLPLFLVGPCKSRRRLLSLPHAPAAGLLADTPEIARALEAGALELAGRLCGGRMHWRDQPAPQPDSQWPGLATYRLPLPETAEALWRGFRSEIRNRTRKAQKNGVTVREGRELLPNFYRIYERHMRELGTPPHPPIFFSTLADAEPKRLTVSLAMLGEEPIAGMIRVRHGDVATAVWVSSLARYNAASPVNLLYWEAMSDAIATGARLFDFGRGRPGAGPTVFKIRYGAIPHPLTRHVWPFIPADPVAEAAISPFMETVSRLWRHLPLPVATSLGRRARRYLP
ncbi:FemAB-related protein, PEP-Cterm system-associated [Solidesulfovibrio fructosivorans JJ]]|uniref:FemAB-related protein, PEP-Cterm system-associated n=1 Tax=Solidesulfovibrio fructosivorans JJ] TaxID=596151 RepID=E1JXW5_SOLFR|nr:GNAT family N-acetyltransferase [Solidesulfovibrio fructosivorans]EFL50888.1 FemAB-related protein, PEP-Cterm system-associated [Solidesulfovibrio fructosivorans JJ]]